jgi:hypothetical protein
MRQTELDFKERKPKKVKADHKANDDRLVTVNERGDYGSKMTYEDYARTSRDKASRGESLAEWDTWQKGWLLDLRAKGSPFSSIAEGMKKYLGVYRTKKECRVMYNRILKGKEEFRGCPNLGCERSDWRAEEIKRLKIIRKYGGNLLLAKQVLCRSGKSIKNQVKLIESPIL